MLAACWRRNSAPARLDALRCRLDLRLLEDRPHSARRQPDAERGQFALNPPITPARVLARQPHNELAYLDGRLRATGTAMRIRPTARDQFAVPTQERPRSDEQRPLPGLPWQHAAKC